MKFFESLIASKVAEVFPLLFNKGIEASQLSFQPTRKDFEGDVTLVVFNLSKLSGKSPEQTGTLIGEALVKQTDLISGFNVIKGFLNLSINNSLWLKQLHDTIKSTVEVTGGSKRGESAPPILIEYSSPNTNKPLHLGHIRNNLLGYSLSEILKHAGEQVLKVNIVNDRGIHICKSMIAWKKYGNGETPQSAGLKGDHLVGKYYVEFDKRYKQEMSELMASGLTEEMAAKQAPLMKEAQLMLQQWEANDPETIKLWTLMNSWVYEGFEVTYKKLGVDFDKIYYESETYLLGKEIVNEGLAKGVLFTKNDGSVWIDLKDDGLDEKLLRRSDGTSVYITQDLGTAVMRYNEFKFDRLIYVVGNEQEYHFKVLFLVLKKLGYEWADKLYHLSYNMVDLPSGKMKSREGTVVDADELIDNMVDEAGKLTRELGKLDDYNTPDAIHLFNQLGLGALKYFILKVDPEKRMLFDPNESIDFNGHTGPFIQYTHARVKSVLRKADGIPALNGYKQMDVNTYENLIPKEKELVKTVLRFDDVAAEAAVKFSPALIANYVYELAKTYNQFYHDHPIADADAVPVSLFRLKLSEQFAATISRSMKLLGIEVPERM